MQFSLIYRDANDSLDLVLREIASRGRQEDAWFLYLLLQDPQFYEYMPVMC
jgi:hypothetical protein